MEDFKVGQYVAYIKGERAEIGRISKVTPHNCFVCYSLGCTDACTPKEFLKPISNDYVIYSSGLGFNRFNESCECYDSYACIGCVHHGE